MHLSVQESMGNPAIAVFLLFVLRVGLRCVFGLTSESAPDDRMK